MDFNIAEAIPKLAMFFPAFLFALCFHEYAHGWMAKKFGDDTAESMGRLTMNPVAHADLIGTIILPIFAIVTGAPLFGWAKPVPVNPRNLKNPKTDMFWVAFAGPLSNVLLAVVGAVIMVAGVGYITNPETQQTFMRFFHIFIFFNILLAVFNMIPLHPLDGGKVIQRFIPESWNRALEENQGTLQIILLVFFIGGGFRYLAAPIEYMQSNLIRGVINLFG